MESNSITGDLTQKTLRLFSVPRSGSTLLASELSTRTGYQYLAEPIRRIQKDIHSIFYTGKYIELSDIQNLEVSNDKENIYIKELFLSLQDRSYLIKETDSIFWIPALKQYFKDHKFLILQRNLLGSFLSHVEINNIFKFWKYSSRIKVLSDSLKINSHIPRFKEYSNIYERANDSTFKNSNELSLLLAHLGVQSLELSYLANNLQIDSIDYADLLNNKNELINLFLEKNDISNNGINRVLNGGTYIHTTHSTKHNVSDSKRWIQFFSKKDLSVIRHIFQDRFQDLISDNDALRMKEQLATSSFVDIYGCKEDEKPDFTNLTIIEKKKISFPFIGKNILVDNMPVLNSDFCAFLNECIDNGIELPHKEIYYGYTVKEMDIDPNTGLYICNKVSENSPAVFLSTLTCAIYAIYKNAKIGNTDLYKELHKNLINTSSTGNVSETFPSTINCGIYSPIEGLYDIFGNIKELCIKNIEKNDIVVNTYGGSYKEEKYFSGNGTIIDYPWLVGDENVGFRLFYNDTKYNNINVFNLIKELSKIKDIRLFKSRCYEIIRLASL